MFKVKCCLTSLPTLFMFMCPNFPMCQAALGSSSPSTTYPSKVDSVLNKGAWDSWRISNAVYCSNTGKQEFKNSPQKSIKLAYTICTKPKQHRVCCKRQDSNELSRTRGSMHGKEAVGLTRPPLADLGSALKCDVCSCDGWTLSEAKHKAGS